jgi:uncharacterized membrane protein
MDFDDLVKDVIGTFAIIFLFIIAIIFISMVGQATGQDEMAAMVIFSLTMSALLIIAIPSAVIIALVILITRFQDASRSLNI